MKERESKMLREAEIRPEHLRQGQAERLARDIARLLQHKDQFVRVSCPACGSEACRNIFEKFGLAYVVCERCETVYVNPRPSPEILEDYYANSENYAYWNEFIFPASEEARREKIFRPRAERLVDLCKRCDVAAGTLMEVGAGFGTFCEEARRIGCFSRIVAVEPTPGLAETCRKRGLDVMEKPVEQIDLRGEKTDVVACFEVIEHLFCPRDFLRGCSSLLQPGGLLVLTCPNVKGFDVTVLQELSDTFDNEHLNYFHPQSLARLLGETGFEVLELLTPGKLDAEIVRKRMLEGEPDPSAQPFLRQVLIERWEQAGDAFQRFLADNLLSSHMWAAARKKPK